MRKRIKLYATIAISGIALFGTVIASGNLDNALLFGKVKADNTYQLTLNTSNRITSNISSTTSKTQQTHLGNEIRFNYTNCNANNSYHAVINNGGTIINIDPIGGITAITPVFTGGQLKLRAGKNSTSLGGYATLKSGSEYEFIPGSLPNYIELSASGSAVSLTSAGFSYECTPAIEEGYEKVTSALSDYSGTYLIVDETSSVALLTHDESSNTFNVSINNGRILKSSNTETNHLTFTKLGDEYTIRNDKGKYLDWGSTLFWTDEYKASITYTNNLFKIYRGSYSFYYNGTKFVYNSSSLTTSSRYISLYKANFDTNEVVYDCGITATDNKASTYVVGDIFDNLIGGKGLHVSLNKSDSSSQELSPSEFSYVIKNGNTTIPSNTAFTSTGNYTVYVTYNDYFTTSYQITVNEQGAVSDDYVLVTNNSDLEEGQSVIIVGIESGDYFAMSTTQNTNNRGRTQISVEDNVAEISETTCEFELRSGNITDTYSFYDKTNGGYIYAASSGSNYLKTQSTLSDNSSFSISVSSNGQATVTAQGSNTHNLLRHNTGSDIFSCYESGQQPVYLYAKGTGAAKVLVSSVSFDTESLSLTCGAEYTLTTTVLPTDASNKELNWTTSDNSVATIDSTGKVTATGVGSATITATSKDGSNKSATCTVTVTAVAVTGVTVSPTSLSIYVGDSSTLSATISPSNASNKDVTWSTSDGTVASVSSDGSVTALKAGTATITVDTNDGHKQATCTVTVNNRSVTGITFSESEVNVKVGKTADLTVIVSPENATNKNLTWTSSDTSKVEITSSSETSCTIRGVAEGDSIIRATATDGSGVYGECTVHVQPSAQVDTWTLVTNANSLHAGDLLVLASHSRGMTAGDISSQVMQAVSSAFGENNTTITELNEDSVIFTLGGTSGAWTLSNSNNEKLGVTEAKKLAWDDGTTTWSISVSGGDATISSTDSDKGRFLYNTNSPRFTTYTSNTSASMLLPQLYVGTSTTPVYPTSIDISGSNKIAASEMTQLSVSFTPSTVNQKTVLWSSSNESIATVGDDGTVTGISAGSATITAKAKASATDSTYTITDTFVVTVTPIASLTLNKSELNLTVDGSDNLSATVLPSNAPNKNVNWSVINANPSGCVTVTNGVVIGVAAGTATVKATAVADSNKYATCSVTVTSSGGGGGGTAEYEDATMTAGTNGTDCTVNGNDGIKIGTNSKGGSMTITVPAGATELVVYTAAWNGVTGLSLNISSNNSGVTSNPSSISLTANSGISNNSPFTLSNATVDDFKFTIALSGVTQETVFTFETSSAKRCVVWGAQYAMTQIEATGVSLTNCELSPGGSTKIATSFTPEGANYHKELSWERISGSNKITVSSEGVVSATSDAPIGNNVATIKATLVNVTINNQHPSATCTVSIVETQKDAWTLLFYVCGSNLESGNGDAKKDLQEILQVRSQQPDDVNIVVETGGSTAWQMPNVSASKLQRWEIDSSCSSTNMRKVQELANANMGDQSTFESFLEWGVTNYPAEKYGVFMWNHGGAMDGCCFDDNFEKASNGNGLLPKELSAAATNVRNTLNITNKFEFIAYDACLMAVQDIALWNARDFNYQISSQETEWSGGYDYDRWLPTLYSDPRGVSTPTVLAKIGDTFMEYYSSQNDQTQSVFDLSKMAAYKTAFDNFTDSVTSIVTSKNAWTTFAGYINQALKYGYDEDASQYNGGYVYDIFDVKGAITAVKNGYSSLSSVCQAVLNALEDVVIYNKTGTKDVVKGSCGMNLFCPLSGYNQLTGQTYSGVYYPANYDSTCTLFTKWQTFVKKYGSWS